MCLLFDNTRMSAKTSNERVHMVATNHVTQMLSNSRIECIYQTELCNALFTENAHTMEK